MKVVLYQIIYLLCWRWAALCLRLQKGSARAGIPKLLLVPCEPWSVTGSRGDEAMLIALVQDFRERCPWGEVVLVSAVGAEPGRIKTGLLTDARIERVWRGRVPLLNIVRCVRRESPSECYVLGADCMDGHYSVLTSLTLLATADLCARLGISARLTGFSFNATPSRFLSRCFRLATGKLPLCLRDPVSLERFAAKTGCSAELLADVAFLLRPALTERNRPIVEWVRQERTRGQRVLGFNVHAHLFSGKPQAQARTVEEIGRQVCDFLSTHPTVSCLLVPHDFRDGGDLACLLPIAERLQGFAGRVAVLRAALSAAELKGVCGELDGVFTSRMHLAIAALGMGKPVAGFCYQGKFEGLYQHFDYPHRWLLDVNEASRLSETLKAFAAEWPELSRHVSSRLPTVLTLAQKIFPARGTVHG